MRLLVLGGTRFLGRAVARRSLDAGHEVTCAARGVSGQFVPGARFVAVDRDARAGMSALDGQRFDAVIVVTSRLSHARRAVAELATRVGHWSYVSTMSVYADDATPGQRAATAPVLAAAPAGIDDGGPEHEWYGACKVSCEEAVREGIGPDRSFICRAGLIAGPEDRGGRRGRPAGAAVDLGEPGLPRRAGRPAVVRAAVAAPGGCRCRNTRA